MTILFGLKDTFVITVFMCKGFEIYTDLASKLGKDLCKILTFALCAFCYIGTIVVYMALIPVSIVLAGVLSILLAALFLLPQLFFLGKRWYRWSYHRESLVKSVSRREFFALLEE